MIMFVFVIMPATQRPEQISCFLTGALQGFLLKRRKQVIADMRSDRGHVTK